MANIIGHGNKITVKNVTLNDTSDIGVGFDKPVNTVILQARTAVDFYIRDGNAEVDYFTVKSGTVLTLNLFARVNQNGIQATNLYLRAASGTPVVEIIGLYVG